MKLTCLMFMTALMAACGAGEFSQSNLHRTGNHFQATACELSVQRVRVWRGSHNSRTIGIFLQTHASLEQQAVDQVGFHHAADYETTLSVELDYDFRDEKAVPQDLEKHTYLISKSVTGEFGQASFHGAFYVRTKDGDTFWLQPEPYHNYTLDEALFAQVLENSQTPESGHAEVLTADVPALAEFNPHGCQ